MPASHPLCVPKATRGHPHQWEGVGSRRRVGPGAWEAASSFCLGFRNLKSPCLGVTPSSPDSLSRPFSRSCSVSSPQMSHGSWPPGQTILKDGRRALSLTHPSPCQQCFSFTCPGAQHWVPGLEGSPGSGLKAGPRVWFYFFNADSGLWLTPTPPHPTHPPCG